MLLQAQFNWHPGWWDNTVLTATLHWKSFSSDFQKAILANRLGYKKSIAFPSNLVWTFETRRTFGDTAALSLRTAVRSLSLWQSGTSRLTLLWPHKCSLAFSSRPRAPSQGTLKVISWVTEPSQVLCGACHCPLIWLLAEMLPVATDTQVATVDASGLVLPPVSKGSSATVVLLRWYQSLKCSWKCTCPEIPVLLQCWGEGPLLELFHIPATSLKGECALCLHWRCALRLATRPLPLAFVTGLLGKQLFSVSLRFLL